MSERLHTRSLGQSRAEHLGAKWGEATKRAGVAARTWAEAGARRWFLEVWNERRRFLAGPRLAAGLYPTVRVFLRCSFFLLLAGARVGAATPEERALQPYVAPVAPEAKAWPRERLLGFMRELADFVQKNHVVTDPQRKTYGMVYEFWKDGKKMQEFGLDTMHDGTWWMSALVTAQRADDKGDWLARAQKYQVPFYAHLLNHSDALFFQMQPTEEDKRPWNNPVKGWAPRGWDDGSGIDRKTGKALADGYHTGSNHLAQDLADTLLNVWLTTRDPQVAEALGHLRDYKQQCFGGIQGIEIAAAVSAGQANGFLKYRLPDFSLPALAPYYAGLFEKKAQRLLSYDDGLDWLYRQGTAAALIAGEPPRGLSAHLVARCYGAQAAMETFFDDRPMPYGAWFFDLQRAPGFVEGKGKLEVYASTAKNFYGSRGVQIASVAAGVLPELKASPALWDAAGKKNALDARVRMLDEPPTTDGTKDAAYARSAALGDDAARVSLVSDPRNLHVFIETSRSQLTVTFQEENGEIRVAKTAMVSEPKRTVVRHLTAAKKKTSSKSKKKKGRTAAKKTAPVKEKMGPPLPPEPVFARGGKLVVTREGVATMTNEKGEPLLHRAAFKAAPEFKQGEGEVWMVEVRIPYTFVPAQNAWINGVDFGRYKVGIDIAPQQTVSIVSEAARVQKRLEQGVLGTIDYWHKVWKETGVIPSGWRTPTVPASGWEISDAGGYAHLLKTMALWVIYQDGHREWEIIREQFPAGSMPAVPLPASVLKAQGF